MKKTPSNRRFFHVTNTHHQHLFGTAFFKTPKTFQKIEFKTHLPNTTLTHPLNNTHHDHPLNHPNLFHSPKCPPTSKRLWKCLLEHHRRHYKILRKLCDSPPRTQINSPQNTKPRRNNKCQQVHQRVNQQSSKSAP